ALPAGAMAPTWWAAMMVGGLCREAVPDVLMRVSGSGFFRPVSLRRSASIARRLRSRSKASFADGRRRGASGTCPAFGTPPERQGPARACHHEGVFEHSPLVTGSARL